MDSYLKLLSKFSIGVFGRAVVSLITMKILSSLYSPSDFGVFSMFNTVHSVLLLVSLLGTNYAFQRFYYESEDRGRLLGACVTTSLISFAAVSTATLICWKCAARFISAREDPFVTTLLLSSVFLSVVQTFSMQIIQFERMAGTYSSLLISQNLIFTILIAVFSKSLKSYHSLLISNAISLFTIALIASMLSSKRVVLRRANFDEMRAVFKYGLSWSTALFSSWLIIWSDRILIRYMLGMKEVGMYSMALKVSAIMILLQNSFYNFWQPVAYKRFSEFPNDQKFFSKALNVVALISLATAFLVITFLNVFKILISPRYYDSLSIVPLLLIPPVSRMMYLVTDKGIDFTKKVHWYYITSLSGAALNIALNVFTIPRFGTAGAAMSTALSFTFLFYFRTLVSMKLYKVGYDMLKVSLGLTLIWIISTLVVFSNTDEKIAVVGMIFTLLLYRKETKEIVRRVERWFTR